MLPKKVRHAIDLYNKYVPKEVIDLYNKYQIGLDAIENPIGR